MPAINWSRTGEEAKFVRENRLGWTQTQLAQHAGVTQRLISKLETGKCVRPSAQIMDVLAVLGIEPIRMRRVEPVSEFSMPNWDVRVETLETDYELRGRFVEGMNPWHPRPPSGKSRVDMHVGGMGWIEVRRPGKGRGHGVVKVRFEDAPEMWVEVTQ